MEIKIGDRFRWYNEPEFVWEMMGQKPENSTSFPHDAKCISVGEIGASDGWNIGIETPWNFNDDNWIYIGNFNKE